MDGREEQGPQLSEGTHARLRGCPCGGSRSPLLARALSLTFCSSAVGCLPGVLLVCPLNQGPGVVCSPGLEGWATRSLPWGSGPGSGACGTSCLHSDSGHNCRSDVHSLECTVESSRGHVTCNDVITLMADQICARVLYCFTSQFQSLIW